jgi:hypothetical protein
MVDILHQEGKIISFGGIFPHFWNSPTASILILPQVMVAEDHAYPRAAS